MMPPVLSGIHDIVTEVLLTESIDTEDTGFGGACGVMLDDVDGAPDPEMFLATTVNVYAVPLTKFDTTVDIVGKFTVTITIDPEVGVAVIEYCGTGCSCTCCFVDFRKG